MGKCSDVPSQTPQVIPKSSIYGGAKVQVTGHRSGYRPQATGQVTGQVTGHRLQATGHRSQATGQVTGHTKKQ